MKDSDCVELLQWALPKLGFRWPGFRKVRRQVCRRIDRRINELNLSSPADYRKYLEADESEWAVLDEFCRISISRFYRDRGVFDCLCNVVLPQLAKMTRARGESELRCWSAGCASGEEPYTLSLLWRLCWESEYSGMTFSISATDSDPHMLQRARNACYPRSSLKDLPQRWISVAFSESNQDELLYRLKPEYRDGIQWICQDIRNEMLDGTFHIILCRHLAFTYFDTLQQQLILDQLVNKLEPGGFLVTGKQEQIQAKLESLRSLDPPMGIYQKPE